MAPTRTAKGTRQHDITSPTPSHSSTPQSPKIKPRQTLTTPTTPPSSPTKPNINTTIQNLVEIELHRVSNDLFENPFDPYHTNIQEHIHTPSLHVRLYPVPFSDGMSDDDDFYDDDGEQTEYKPLPLEWYDIRKPTIPHDGVPALSVKEVAALGRRQRSQQRSMRRTVN